jgi:hypothetical protein
MLKFNAFAISCLLFSCWPVTPLPAASVSININATNPGPRLNPRMYGIFLEEINHGVDGGLYAEMIRNRGFEDAKPPEGFTFRPGTGGRPGRWMAGQYDVESFARGVRLDYFNPDGTMKDFPYWSLVKQGAAQGSMNLDTNNPLDPAGPRSLRLEIDEAGSGRLGIANEGFFGIGVEAAQKYNLSFWARGEGFSGPLTASVEDAAGAACVEPATLNGVTGQWKQFHAVFTATKTEAKGRFMLTWFRSFPPGRSRTAPTGFAPIWPSFSPTLNPASSAFPAAASSKAAASKPPTIGRIASVPCHRGRSSLARGVIARRTAWGCMNTCNSARTWARLRFTLASRGRRVIFAT